jgi:molecular chaperone GrpE
MFSIEQELRRLSPISLGEGADEPRTPSAIEQWDALATALTRSGKQQLRANQNVSVALEQTAAALAQAEENAKSLREQVDADRRELQRLRDDARETRLVALGTIDTLDDLLVMARQKGEPQWIDRVEKLVARTLDVFAQMGLSEIPAEGRPFDEQAHEALDAVERGERDPFVVVEVVRRGFRYQGAVLRRSQVVATR